jgi:hypothetical protein
MSNPAFEVEDFSGGMTDFFLQGDRKRYQFADNLLINEDRKLFLRPGSEGFDWYGNHRLPETTRIGTFLRFNEAQEQIVQQARKLFYLGTNWTEVTGPDGAPAISAASPFDAISWTEWKGHTYFASTGGGLPGKLYRDPAGAFQVRTAGLPLPVSAPRYSKSGLLAACIALANDLRASMMQHVVDTNIHAYADYYAKAYFITTALLPTDTRTPPTPAPAATDQASLFVLVKALNACYEYHGADPGLGDAGFHLNVELNVANVLTIPPKGPFKKLTDNGTPAELVRAARQLDELRQRWYWHRLGLFTHSTYNVFSAMDLYPVAAPAVGNTDTVGSPQVAQNIDDLIRYVGYLKSAYNQHVTNGRDGAAWNVGNRYEVNYPHSQRPLIGNDPTCTLPDPTDVDSCYLTIYWIWAMYGAMHYSDANIATHTNTTMDTTAGSANIADVGAGTFVLNTGDTILSASPIFDAVDPNERYAATVVTPGTGTATLNKTVLNTLGDTPIQVSKSAYHGAYTNGAFTTVTTSQVSVDEKLEPLPGSGYTANNQAAVGSSMKEWLDLAKATFIALSFHTQNADAHQQTLPINLYLTDHGQFFAPEVASYGYAFVWKTTYTTENGVEFEVESEPTFVGPIETAKVRLIGTTMDSGLSAQDTAITDGLTNNVVNNISSPVLSNLPTLANTAITNYEVSTLKLEIFRTQDGGNTYYKLDEVLNGVATYTDSASDTESTEESPILSDREPLYVTGGEVVHTQAPECRFLHIFSDTAYFGYIKDTGQVFPDRVIQSIPGAPDTGPATFSLDLGDELMGITSTRSNVLALCRNSIHRLQGGFTNLGQGNLSSERIVGEAGCISSKSIVQTEIGVFFAGTDGFYYTDGFQLIKISIDLNKTYLSLTKTRDQASRIHGKYDKRSRRIWWSVSSESSATECDRSYVYYLDYGVKPAGVFTGPIQNGTHWAPTALDFFQDDMIRGDARGLLLRHNEKFKGDCKIPASSDDFDALDQWGKVHIPYRYLSCALDFGTISVGSYVTKIHLLGANDGNVNVQIAAIADNNNYARSKKDLAPIRFRDNLVWGDPSVVWGDPLTEWKTDGRLDVSRHFPSGNLRAQLKQIEIRPASTGVYKYDEYPEESFCDVAVETIDGVAYTRVNLATPDGYTELWWPMDVVGMSIAFEADNYETEFPITEWFNNRLTITDADEALVLGLTNQKWVIRGYMKEAGFHVLAYALDMALFGGFGNPAVGNGGENG